MNFYKFMQSQAKYMKVNGSYACGGGVRSDFISAKKRSDGEGVKGSGDYVVGWCLFWVKFGVPVLDFHTVYS